MTIKAIETQYKGYRFRSRLEARWAVFFERAGIEWQYEPEGFDLGETGYYLPDFYLPESKRYIEVKPDMPTTREFFKMMALAQAHNKASDEQSPLLHYLLCGTPGYPGFTARAVPISSDPDGIDSIYGIEIKPSSYIALAMVGSAQYPIEVNAFYTLDRETKPYLDFLYYRRDKIANLPAKIEAQDVTARASRDDLAVLMLGMILFTTEQNIKDGKDGADIFLFRPSLSIYVGDGRRVYSQPLRKAYEAARSARFEHGETPT